MPLFVFTARDTSGRSQSGRQEAPSPQVLVSTLRARGLLVLEVRQADASDAETATLLERLNPGYWLPPRSIDVEISLQQLGVMLRSGLTLLESLKTMAEQASRPSMRRIWRQTALRIQQGSGLADAMMEHRCFPHLVIQLVRVGEQTGTLESVVNRAAGTMERRRLLRTSLLTALMYPTIVFFAAIGVSVFMVLGVIPKLKTFLSSLGRRLPPMTQFLLDFSDFVQQNGLPIFLGIVGFIVALICVYLWPPGRYFLDHLMLRVWPLGRLFRLSATVLVAHALGTLIRSGITLVEALRTVEELPANRYVAAQIANARAAVLRGSRLADPLDVRDAFMPMLSRMVAVGEQAGTLDDILDEVARFHEMQLQGAIRQFSALIEPVIIIVVGGIVGFVYISFFMALFAAAGGAR
ncbi:MAG: type II secretion system F family protein [Planctomycetia bacterium]|nr:type II secretion system F family protein [Planctomycetia bacterium]